MRHPSWNALTRTGLHFQDGQKTQQTWATTRSLMTVTKLYQTTKTIGATGSVTRGSGWFLRLRLGRHVLRRRHADDVTRDAASRHTTTNYQLASLYCAPLKPATQPGGSHKRLKAFSGSKVRRCLKTVSLQMGRGPALSIYSRLNCSASDGQQAMTAKPSTAQLRRWFILLYSLSQMIHS